MNLDRYSAEPAYWRITADVLLDGEAPEVAIGDETTWYQTVWDTPTAAKERVCRLLLRGPDAPAAVGSVDVAVGDHRTWTRTPIGTGHIVRAAAKVYCS